jgi:hypothetical protein
VNDPVPLVVHEPEPVDEVPFNATAELLAQTLVPIPAFTVGGAVYLMVSVSATAKQLILLVEVSVRVTKPPEISLALETYVALSEVLLGVNVPVPLVLHCAAPVLDVPLSVAFGLFEQTKISAPPLTIGAGLIVTTIVFVTAKQFPFPADAIVNVTVPTLISAELGV